MSTYAHIYRKGQGGYIALMATVIISLVLMVMIVKEGFTGWSTRFSVLGTEAKEQANALAEGCSDQALASLITNPNYLGNTTSHTPGGDCKVMAISPTDLQAGVVTIKTQAVVRNAYANLELLEQLNNIHLGNIPTAPTYGTLIVQTLVSNPSTGPQKTPADFTANVASVSGTSPTTFGGSATGVVVKIPTPVAAPTSAYSVTESAISGYAASLTGGCSGTIHGGDIKSCTITNSPVTTTLTLIASVKNSNGTGSLAPTDFPLFIDGTAATLGHAYTVNPGAHAVTATNPNTNVYGASQWGYQCSGAINAGSVTTNIGDNKICIINFADNPPPAPICADTVMMLDRSLSMFGYPNYPAGYTQWIPDEKVASKALVDLYAGITTSHPLIGVGRFGDTDTGHNAEIFATLSNAYTAIKTAIDNGLPQNPIGYTNLADAITKGNGELNGPNHQAGKQKVLILLSDGDPNEPTTGATVSTTYFSPTGNAQNASGEFWSNPQNAYQDGGGDASDPVSENDHHRFYSFNIPTIPSTATIKGIEVEADAWATTTGTIAGPATNIQKAPSSLIAGGQWLNGTNAYTSNDVYATDATLNHVQSFGNFGFNIPANATIVGIALGAEAKVSGGGSSLTTPTLFPNGQGADGNWNGGESDIDETGTVSCSSSDQINSNANGNRESVNIDLSGIPNGSLVTSVQVLTFDQGTSGGQYLAFASVNSSRTNSGTISVTSTNGCNARIQTIDVPDFTKASATDFEVGVQKVGNTTVQVGAVRAIITYTPPASGSVALSLSSNNGGAWTATKSTALDGTESVDAPSGNSSSDLWGRTWVPADFADGKFAVRMQNTSTSGTTVSLDQVLANVYYTLPAPAPAQCDLGIDLSWNGGSNWTTEKTQLLNNNETTYTLGSPTDDWGSHTWAPGEFVNGSNKFLVRVHAIDPGTNCDNASIDHLDWLRTQVTYNVPASPSEAALSAADTAKKGPDGVAGTADDTDIFTIYFGSGDPAFLSSLATGNTANANPAHQPGSADNLSNNPASGNTAYTSPTTNVKDTGGAGNGFEVSPQNAYADGGTYAQNVNGMNDRHRFGGYNFASIPANSTISGIVVRTDWWTESTSGTNSISVDLSWDGGTSWTAAKSQGTESTSDTNSKTVGASNDAWGHAWTLSDLDPSKFVVRVTSLCSGSANPACSTRDFYLDWLPVQVYYTGAVPENGDSDNFFVSPTSADMKGIFEFIGGQVCPAINNVAASTPPTTASLYVITQVINNNNGTNVAGDFGNTITASNASPATWSGVDSPGKTITLDPGTYSLTQSTMPAGYTQTMSDSCNSSTGGNIVAGEQRVCVITDDDIPPPPPSPNLTITPGSWQEVPDTTP